MTDINRILYGKYALTRIVNCEPRDGFVDLFIQKEDGNIEIITKPFNYWFLTSRKTRYSALLQGKQHYAYINKFNTLEDFNNAKKKNYNDLWTVYDFKEMAMILYGFTYYKDLELKELTTLAFDIETNGLSKDENSDVFLISNVYRKNGEINKRLFSFKDYATRKEMIEDWCKFIKEIDPSIMIGHNVFGYDLPYLKHVADLNGVDLNIGRNGSPVVFNERKSKYRKEASQFYEYHNAFIYGREVVDTKFLAIKYDAGARKYENFGLKQISKQEGFAKEDRVYYDASQIKYDIHDNEKYPNICQYCIDDSEETLKLFELMIPSFFYLNRIIPKPIQSIINSATGSQLNSLLTRAYIQDGYSIPKADEKMEFVGAISFGMPGIYKNLIKADISSLYPSIILAYDIFDKLKDPGGYFFLLNKELRNMRLENKTLAKQTGNSYYDDLANSQKIIVNSLYGLCGAPGLNFNSPNNAALITKYGREILQKAIKWATGSELNLNKIEENKEE